MANNFYALMIGNSRFHWAKIQAGQSQGIWHCPHTEPLPQLDFPLVFASVVPTQGDRLQAHFPDAREIQLVDLPLKNLYATLGIDRALALYGAGESYGYPCLVIDGGTALTLSGIDGDRRFIGGAILPGLRLQFQMLAQGTAALPQLTLPEQLPERWARNTEGAIASGIVQTVLAGLTDFMEDWRTQYPHSAIVMTGGDSQRLQRYLSAEQKIIYAPNLVLEGLVKLAQGQAYSG